MFTLTLLPALRLPPFLLLFERPDNGPTCFIFGHVLAWDLLCHVQAVLLHALHVFLLDNVTSEQRLLGRNGAILPAA